MINHCVQNSLSGRQTIVVWTHNLRCWPHVCFVVPTVIWGRGPWPLPLIFLPCQFYVPLFAHLVLHLPVAKADCSFPENSWDYRLFLLLPVKHFAHLTYTFAALFSDINGWTSPLLAQSILLWVSGEMNGRQDSELFVYSANVLLNIFCVPCSVSSTRDIKANKTCAVC